MATFKSTTGLMVSVLGVIMLFGESVEGGKTTESGLLIPLSDRDPATLATGMVGDSSPQPAINVTSADPAAEQQRTGGQDAAPVEAPPKGQKRPSDTASPLPPPPEADSKPTSPAQGMTGAAPRHGVESYPIPTRPPSETAWRGFHANPKMADEDDERFDYSEPELPVETSSGLNAKNSRQTVLEEPVTASPPEERPLAFPHHPAQGAYPAPAREAYPPYDPAQSTYGQGRGQNRGSVWNPATQPPLPRSGSYDPFDYGDENEPPRADPVGDYRSVRPDPPYRRQVPPYYGYPTTTLPDPYYRPQAATPYEYPATPPTHPFPGQGSLPEERYRVPGAPPAGTYGNQWQ